MSTSLNALLDGAPDTIKLPVSILYRIGWFQAGQTKLNVFVAFFATIVCCIMAVGSVLFSNAESVPGYIQNLEGIFSAGHCLTKLIVVFCQNQNLKRLVRNTNKFWDAGNDVDKTEYNLTREFVIRIEKASFGMVLATASVLILVTYLYNIITLGVWTLDGYHIVFRVLQIMQSIYVGVGGPLMCLIVLLYLGFCSEVIIQFKIISSCLKQLAKFDCSSLEAEQFCLEKLKSCIRHHQFMTRYLKDMQNVFSFVMFFEYITDVPLLLAEWFAALESTSFALQTRCLMVIVYVIIQLAFFCIPATYISLELLEVSKSAYFCNWESRLYPSLKIPLIILMQSSQQKVVIKAGRMITMNADTVVVKAVWTATSIFRGLK